MADRIKQIPKRIVEIWKSWSKKQKTIILSSTAVFLIAVIILAVVLNQPNYETLTTCSDYNEMSQVTQLLTDNNYTYKG